uniref:Predicted protein n=1 Tax=Hordeum vulgare subsp. vulgare TaxID=112509 RepID=F2DCU1_HORVV|nr:predicted protein [Hordeum vulgare subsp. vulgare]
MFSHNENDHVPLALLLALFEREQFPAIPSANSLHFFRSIPSPPGKPII